MVNVIKNWLKNRRADYLVLRSAICHRLVLWKIRHRPAGQKIKVVFYVYDAAKWKCQALYDFMASSDDFDPVVAIGQSPYNAVSKAADTSEAALCALEDFFKKCGCRTVRVAGGFPIEFVDLKTLNPDVVFLQQPWSLPDKYEPWNISRYALPVYVPYYVQVRLVPDLDCAMPFHRCLYAYFVLSKDWQQAMTKAMEGNKKTTRYIPCGHPALDCYSRCATSFAKEKIIYAPHFSFSHPNNKALMPYGTFEWNGREILEYAKAHPQFKWVFKPHPSLKDKCIDSGFMTRQEVERYYDEWREIGQVSLDGGYDKLFREARAMITDSSSFLAEFGATGSPLIYLVSQGMSNEVRINCSSYVDAYYQVHNIQEMKDAFELVIEKSADPLRERRSAALRDSGLLGNNASGNIVEFLRLLCKRMNEKLESGCRPKNIEGVSEP